MSRLKNRIAEIQQMEDGKWLNTDTGEITDYKPQEDKPGVKFTEEKQQAKDVYLNDNYYNMYGKVSPFNIIMVDQMNSLVSMDVKSAADSIINTIEQLNKTYGGDPSYDYVKQDYINEMKYNFSKIRTIDKVLEYFTNAWAKGMGMSNNKRKHAGLNKECIIKLNLNDYKTLQNLLIGLSYLKK